jgi:hypothetical protein
LLLDWTEFNDSPQGTFSNSTFLCSLSEKILSVADSESISNGSLVVLTYIESEWMSQIELKMIFQVFCFYFQQ